MYINSQILIELKKIYIKFFIYMGPTMEDPTDISLKNARWLDIWFSIGVAKVSGTPVSRHHLTPKFKYIELI